MRAATSRYWKAKRYSLIQVRVLSLIHILPIEVCDLMEALSRLRETGVKVISGCLEGSSELPAQIGRACVVIGNEARGISAQVREASDDLYKIEIYGRAESLNASVAAGIMLYDVRKNLI